MNLRSIVLSCLILAAVAPMASIAAAADSPQVDPVPAELRDSLKLDPFYAKHTNAGGLPVLSSAKVSDAALIEAASLIGLMLSDRDDLRQAMIDQDVRFVVMAPDEMTTDVPEQRDMKPKKYWDARAAVWVARFARAAKRTCSIFWEIDTTWRTFSSTSSPTRFTTTA